MMATDTPIKDALWEDQASDEAWWKWDSQPSRESANIADYALHSTTSESDSLVQMSRKKTVTGKGKSQQIGLNIISGADEGKRNCITLT